MGIFYNEYIFFQLYKALGQLIKITNNTSAEWL